MKNKKQKIVLTGIALAVIGLVFQAQIIDSVKGDVKGCMDPLASNYDPLANVSDPNACDFEKPLSADLQKKIEILKKSDWDVDKYTNLRDEILIYFNSIQESNSGQEKNSLENLDMAYMLVLEKTTDQATLDCFRSSSKLKKEVKEFYRKFKNENTSIKNAQSVFDSYNQIYGYKTKVNKLLEKRYVKSDFDALKQKINNFSNSKRFLKFNKCNGLKKIISECIVLLDECEIIDKKYNEFVDEHDSQRLINQFKKPKDFVANRYKFIFKDYKWYYNKVMQTDERLKREKKERDEKQRNIENLEEV